MHKSIFVLKNALNALLGVFPQYPLKQPLKVASTSEELLDLFEDRCTLLEERTTPTVLNDEAGASKSLPVAVPKDLALIVAASTELRIPGGVSSFDKNEPEGRFHKRQ